MKKCRRCSEIKEVSEFPKSPRGVLGVLAHCKACKAKYLNAYYKANKWRYPKRTPEEQAAYNRTRRDKYAASEEYRRDTKKKVNDYRVRNLEKVRKGKITGLYGITVDEYDRLVEADGGRCAICKKEPTNESRQKRLHLDHCHKSGKIRGMLCSACNLGIGKLNDDPELLEAAAAYIRERS